MYRAFPVIVILAGSIASIPVTASAAAGNCVPLTRTLAVGSTGIDVSALQQFFVREYNNFPQDSVSGSFDATTASALEEWQVDHHLFSAGAATTSGYGSTDAKTRTALACAGTPEDTTDSSIETSVHAPPPAIAPAAVVHNAVSGGSTTAKACVVISRSLAAGASGADVSALQNVLVADALLSPDAATGQFGAQTEAALEQWQALRGIVSTGAATTTGYGVVGAKTRAAVNAECATNGSWATNGPSNSGSFYGGSASVSTNSGSAASSPAQSAACRQAIKPIPPCPSGWVGVLDTNGCIASWRCGAPAGTSSTSAAVVRKPPVISAIDAPASLQTGQSGTWRVRASSPGQANAPLQYSAVWGDSESTAFDQILLFTGDANTSQFSPIFIHTYTRPGVYTPVFTVTSDVGTARDKETVFVAAPANSICSILGNCGVSDSSALAAYQAYFGSSTVQLTNSLSGQNVFSTGAGLTAVPFNQIGGGQ